MGRSTLQRHRIRGISFRRSQSGIPQRHGGIELDGRTHAWGEVSAALAQGAPVRLTGKEIRRLLGDHGRAELHTLISDCVEHCQRWKQIWHALDRASLRNHGEPSARCLNPDDEMTLPENEDERLLAVEAHYLFGLWRHRLDMLELISQAQQTLRLAAIAELKRRPSS